MGNAKVIRELRQMQGATRRQTNTLEETDMQTEANAAATVECFKPLIFDFFTDAYDIAKQYTCKEQPSQYEHKEQRVKVEDSMILKEKNGERTRYKFEPFALCPLTPSCNIFEEFRHYEENGHLNESESLFKKHSQESKFLLHVLPFIIEKLVKAHSLYAELVKLQHEKYKNVKNKNNGVNGKMKEVASSDMSLSCDVLLHNVETLNNSSCTEYNKYTNNDDNEEDCDDNVLQGSVIYHAEPNVSALSEEHQEIDNVICDECNRSSHICALNSNDTTLSHNKTRRFHHIECLSSSDESHEEEISSIHIDNNNKDNNNTTLLDAQSEIESLSEVVIALSPITKEQEASGHVSETSAHLTHTRKDEEYCAMQETAHNNSVTDLVSEEEEFNEFEGFYTEVEPDISMYDFMKCIILYTNLSPSSVIIGCIYIDRLLCSYVPLMINKLNVHMLLMSAIRVASKAYDIRIVGTIDFARAINVDEDDLVELEELMIERLHFNLYVAAEEFNKYAFHLIHAAAGISLTHALESWSSMYYYESEECRHEHSEKQKQQDEKEEYEEKEMNTKSKGESNNDNKLWCWESSHRPKLRIMNNINSDVNHHQRHHKGRAKDVKIASLLKELEKLSTLYCHNEWSNTFSTERAKLANHQTLSKLLLPYSLLPPQQPASNMSMSHLWPNSSIAWSDCDKSIECCNISSSNGLSCSALANALRASSCTETSMNVSRNNENNKNNNNTSIKLSVDGKVDMKDAVEMLTRELVNNENATRREHDANRVHSLHANVLLPSQTIYFTLSRNKLTSLKQIEIVTKYITCYETTLATRTRTSCDDNTKDVEANKMKEKCVDSKVENQQKNSDQTEKEQARRKIREKLRLPNATSPIKCTSPSLSSSALPATRPPSSHTEKKKKGKKITNETPREVKGSHVRKEATLHNIQYVNESNKPNNITLPAIVVIGVPHPLHDSSQAELVNSHSLVFAGPTRPRANTIDTIESALPCISNGNTSTILSSSSSSTTNTNDTNNKNSSNMKKNTVASSLILDKQAMPQAQQKIKYENLYDKYNKTRKITNLNTKQDEQYIEKTRVRKKHLPPLATRAKAGQYY